jgi:hypothetical protein
MKSRTAFLVLASLLVAALSACEGADGSPWWKAEGHVECEPVDWVEMQLDCPAATLEGYPLLMRLDIRNLADRTIHVCTRDLASDFEGHIGIEVLFRDSSGGVFRIGSSGVGDLNFDWDSRFPGNVWIPAGQTAVMWTDLAMFQLDERFRKSSRIAAEGDRDHMLRYSYIVDFLRAGEWTAVAVWERGRAVSNEVSFVVRRPNAAEKKAAERLHADGIGASIFPAILLSNGDLIDDGVGEEGRAVIDLVRVLRAAAQDPARGLTEVEAIQPGSDPFYSLLFKEIEIQCLWELHRQDTAREVAAGVGDEPYRAWLLKNLEQGHGLVQRIAKSRQ